MRTCKILLNTPADVRELVELVSRCVYQVGQVSGRYSVDAKSIMGIFSLDLAKPIKMEIYSDDCDAFLEQVKEFSAEG